MRLTGKITAPRGRGVPGKASREETTTGRSGRLKRRRWKVMQRLVVASALVACACFWHKAVLEGTASLLVVHQQQPGFDHILVLGGDRCHDAAARLQHEDPSRRIVLIEEYPNRLVRIGILPSFTMSSRQELAKRGVPAEVVEVIGGEVGNKWAAARLLQRWMNERPGARLLVLCDRFKSRYHRYVLDATLDSQVAARVSVRGLPNRRYNETNWWKSRHGVKSFGFAYLRLAYVWWQGENPSVYREWNPDDYERMLRQVVARAPR